MTDNVTKLPAPKMPNLFGPPLSGCSLVVDGRLVPDFHIRDRGDSVEFVLDGRLCYEFPKDVAYLAASMAANAMAFGAGYAFFGAETKDRPFAPQVFQINLDGPQ